MSPNIANIPSNKAVMVFLPAHGGWYRATVQDTADGRVIRIAGAYPGQPDMHNNLMVGYATHWQDLPSDPIGTDDCECFASALHWFSLHGIKFSVDNEGTWSFKTASEVLHTASPGDQPFGHWINGVRESIAEHLGVISD